MEDHHPYAYDPSFLGETIVDSLLGITFAPPIKWSVDSVEEMSPLNEVYNKNTPHKIKIRHHCSSPGTTNSYFTISEITDWPAEGVKKWNENYGSTKSSGQNSRTSKYFQYSQAGMQVYEWKSVNQVLVIYHLLFMEKGRPICQMDFFIPYPNFDEDMETITESSIASLGLKQ